MKIKGMLLHMLTVTIYACVGIALIRLIPGVNDLVKKYVTGA